jgi:hypothetical protein
MPAQTGKPSRCQDERYREIAMQLQDQALAEFAILTCTGIVMLAVTGLLASDHRGSLTSYTHRCWQFYQRPWYRQMLLWNSPARALCADEDRLRRAFRVVAVSGLAIGMLILSAEFIALVTGHVI